MTTHNSLQQYTDLSRGYKNALGLDEGGLERAGETLTPTFPLFELPEYALQRGELLGAYYGIQAAVVAQYSGIGVGSPPGSRLLVVVEPESRLVVESAGLNYWGVHGMAYADMVTQLPTAGSLYALDTRRWNGAGAMLNNPLPARASRGSAAVPSGDLLGVFYSLDTAGFGESLASIGPLVVSPGYAIAFWSQALNVAVRGHIRVRVRTLQPGEGSA